jgi:hypothetical protein
VLCGQLRRMRFRASHRTRTELAVPGTPRQSRSPLFGAAARSRKTAPTIKRLTSRMTFPHHDLDGQGRQSHAESNGMVTYVTRRAVMAGGGSVFRRCGCTDPVTGRQYGVRCPRLAAGGRHGSWYVRLELAAGLDGRRRRIRRGGYPSRKAAVEVLGRLRNPKACGTAGILTVGDWLAHWLVCRTSAAPSTIRGYAAHAC